MFDDELAAMQVPKRRLKLNRPKYVDNTVLHLTYALMSEHLTYALMQ